MWHDGTIGPVLWDFVQQLEPMEKYQSMPVIFKSDIYKIWCELICYWWGRTHCVRVDIFDVLLIHFVGLVFGLLEYMSWLTRYSLHNSPSIIIIWIQKNFPIIYSWIFPFFFSAITTNKKEAEIRTDIYIFKSSSRFSVILLCAYARALWFDNFDYSSVVRSSFGFCFWWRVASAHGEK